MKLEDIGNIFNVQKERIRQIEAKALRKLRHYSRRYPIERGLQTYLSACEARPILQDIDRLKQKKAALEQDIAALEVKAAQMSVVPSMLPSKWEIPLEDLDLSVRSYNCLHRAGLANVKLIHNAIVDDSIRRVRNLGAKSLDEIKSKMFETIGVKYH